MEKILAESICKNNAFYYVGYTGIINQFKNNDLVGYTDFIIFHLSCLITEKLISIQFLLLSLLRNQIETNANIFVSEIRESLGRKSIILQTNSSL